MPWGKETRGRGGPGGTVAPMLAALVLTLALIVFSGGGIPAHSAFPGANGKIAFSRTGPVIPRGIYVVNLDGTGLRRLSGPTDEDMCFAWSPDGSRIAVKRGGYAIYLMNADGMGQTTLLRPPPYAESCPSSWSPDGLKILVGPAEIVSLDGTSAPSLPEPGVLSPDWKKVAINWYENSRYYVYVATAFVREAGKSDATRLAEGYNPVWSPRGDRILYQNNGPSGQRETHVINVDGTGAPRRVPIGKASSPSWSPDASKIAFLDGSGYGVFVANLDGSGSRLLVPPSNGTVYGVLQISWSPDGTRIAFVGYSEESGQPDVHVMNGDGSSATRLTYDRGVQPAWSPDGTRIAYAKWGDIWKAPSPSDDGIYVMNADGTGQARFQHGVSPTKDPAWSPDGMKIAYSQRRTINVTNGESQNTLAYDMFETIGEAAWSPDGCKIAFRMASGDNYEIRLFDLAGGPETILTEGRSPAWSPDGLKIAFTRTSTSTGTTSIWVMNADGSGQRQTTESGNSPAWSPDGSQIAFDDHEATTALADIYVMNADGSGRRRLTSDGKSRSPDWQPLQPTALTANCPVAPGGPLMLWRVYLPASFSGSTGTW